MKLLASDFDSTLYQNFVISNEDINKIKEWQNKGNKFGLVTGRDEKHLQVALAGYDIDLDFIITNNGACIRYNDELQQVFIHPKTTQELLTFLKGYPCFNVIIYDGENRILVEYDKMSKIHFHKKCSYADLIHYNPVLQCSLNVNDEQLARILEGAINDCFNDLTAYRNKSGVDIICKGLSKATGVQTIYSKFQCEEIYVIGDSKNDLPMIKEFNGFCVANAEEEVKEKANFIYPSVGACIEDLLKKA